MNKERAKSLYLQNVLYKTLAWGFILWIPAAKLADCSPNASLKFVLGSILMDFNTIVLLGLSLVVFFLAGRALKKAEELSKEP